MSTRGAALLALGLVVAGCGNPVHSHYSVKQTAPCLRKLGYTVTTDASKLGPVEASATEGALLAKERGNAVTITFSQNDSEATNIEAGYRHFVSKDELVAEYLREAAKRVDAYWAKIDTPGSAKALDQLSSWLVEMADGLVDGWSCRLTNAAAELKEKSHPARRVIKAHNAMQRRRLARLCRRAGLRSPSMVADALLLLFDGACVMAPIRDRADLASRFVLLGEAWITAHMIRRNRDQVFWRCNS